MKNMFNIKTPTNIYLWWNFGSTIFTFMSIQIVVGMMLSMNYMIKTNMFNSSINIYMNINYGWMMRITHSNMTSLIFIIMIIHMSRSMMFKSFYIIKMWTTGTTMMILMMMESFIGYSLIWNQMSYWAMMVITNFLSSIPMMGKKLLKLIWGNFNINIILINRFFTIHFILPMMIMMISMIHMMILHNNKSNNPLGINNKTDLIKLNPNFIIKDIKLIMVIIMLIMNINMFKNNLFNNNDSFIMMNYFKTPSHIEPEWYFLFFYSILRSINNKLNGLMMLMLSMIMILIMPLMNKNKFQSFFPFNKIMMMSMMNIMIIMSMLSKKNVEYPFKEMNMMLMYMYMLIFLIMYYMNKIWNNKF